MNTLLQIAGISLTVLTLACASLLFFADGILLWVFGACGISTQIGAIWCFLKSSKPD